MARGHSFAGVLVEQLETLEQLPNLRAEHAIDVEHWQRLCDQQRQIDLL